MQVDRLRHLLFIGLAMLVLYRLALLTVLATQGVGLHVDEAQYWWWSQDLQWGYFSKPPGIAALIRLSTALFGDGVTGVRALAVICWVGTALILWALGRSMQRERAGLWAALLLCASLASNWLGMVATTDALLMLGWASVMWLTWLAQQKPSWLTWALAGALLGLTMLGKYTAGALAITWLWLGWRGVGSGAGINIRALIVAGVASLAAFAPHLGWNALNDWPTLRHTAEITIQGAAAAPSDAAHTVADRLLSLAEFSAGQVLLAGPMLVCALACALWKLPVRDLLNDSRIRWSLAFALPLLAVGALQALHSKAQVNWALPMLLGLCMAAGLWLEQLRARAAPWLALAAVTVALTSAISLHGDARLWREPQWQPGAPDIWGRMRGWSDAFERLTPTLRAHPGLPVVASDRSVLAQALYAWRTEKRDLRSWSPTGAVRNHFDWKLPLARASASTDGKPSTEPCAVLFVDEDVPPALRGDAKLERLAQSRSGRVTLALWRIEWPLTDARCLPLERMP